MSALLENIYLLIWIQSFQEDGRTISRYNAQSIFQLAQLFGVAFDLFGLTLVGKAADRFHPFWLLFAGFSIRAISLWCF